MGDQRVRVGRVIWGDGIPVVRSEASLGGTVERRNAGAAGDFEAGAVGDFEAGAAGNFELGAAGETSNVRWAGSGRSPKTANARAWRATTRGVEGRSGDTPRRGAAA